MDLSESSRPSPRTLLHFLLIAALCLAAYLNTLYAPFQLDDYRHMLDLPYVREPGSLADRSALLHYFGDYPFRVRLVGYLSFALNYAMGGAGVVGFHLVNVAIHLANGLLVYALVRATLQAPFFVRRAEAATTQPPPAAGLLPLVAALLFVAHPVQTEAVTYIVQRLASLATFFYLGSVLLYVAARRLMPYGKGGRLCYAGALLAAVLAMETKEISFTLPLALVLYEYLFLSGKTSRRVALLVPFLCTMLIIPVAVSVAPSGAASIAEHLGAVTRVDSALSRFDYFCTEMRVVLTYLRLIFLPVGQNLFYDYPEFHSLIHPEVAASLLVHLLLLAGAVYACRRSTTADPSWRLVGFGIVWFYLTLSVESSLLPIVDVIFEHRLYLPSVGIFLAFGAVLHMLLVRLRPVSRRWLLFLSALLVLLLAGTTAARNTVWQSQESLWRDVVQKSPAKSVGYQGLGMALAEKGDVPAALGCFDKAIALDPDAFEAYSNRGILHARSGRYREAVADFRKATEVESGSAELWNNLGLALSQTGDQTAAVQALAKALELDPEHAEALNNLGLAYARQGRGREALFQFDRALAVNSGYANAYFNRAGVLLDSGNTAGALNDLNRALQLDPRFGEAYTRRGLAFLAVAEGARAAEDFRAACSAGDRDGCRHLADPGGAPRR